MIKNVVQLHPSNRFFCGARWKALLLGALIRNIKTQSIKIRCKGISFSCSIVVFAYIVLKFQIEDTCLYDKPVQKTYMFWKYCEVAFTGYDTGTGCVWYW